MTTNTILKAIHGAVKAGAAVCFIIMALFSGCKDPVNSPNPCNCPNGTVHAYGESCCNDDGCACIKTIRHEINDIVGLPKIFIDDQTGGKLNDDKKTLMRNLINDYKGANYLANFISRGNSGIIFIVDESIANGGEKINGRKVKFSIDFITGSTPSALANRVGIVLSDMDLDTNVD